MLRRFDADETAPASAVSELDDTGHFGEQRVVAADPDVDARLEAAYPVVER